MLMCMPAFIVSNSHTDLTSAAYGASTVFDQFVRMHSGAGNRTLYEETMLRYFYYHNWFSGNAGCEPDQACPAFFFAHAFWVGFAGRSKSYAQLRNFTAQAKLEHEAVAAWNANSLAMPGQDYVYVMGGFPSEAQSLLSGDWDVECQYGGWKHVGTSLLSTTLQDVVSYPVRCPDDLRPQERFTIRPSLITQEQFDDWHLAFFFDARPFVRLESSNNMMLTGFICLVLCVASMQFSKDANALVLRPVERMIEKVNLIRDNPLAAMKMADDEFKDGEEIKKFRDKRGRVQQHVWLEKYGLGWLSGCINLFSFKGGAQDEAMMETAILEKTIIKLGSLLALGFGEAGASIVADNMQGLDSAGVNAMVPGSRVDCIVGSACIRDFSTATEVLQGKVMTFVNQIAEIVHGLVCEFHGAPNKNSGDRFLLIWRLCGLNEEQQSRISDMAMVSCVRILGCAHSNKTLADYRTHPGLIQRLGAHCRVNLSFGLHRGWAIEGAVGSEFKIDASYLSPNVSIAESLEHATKVYTVSLLASQECVSLCSKVLARQCRLIDKVNMKGSKVPLSLYAYDVETQRLPVHEFSTVLEWNVRQRFKARQLFEVEKTRKWAGDIDVVREFIFESADVKVMRKLYTTEFQQLFNMGYQNYSQGEWRVARRLLKATQDMLGFQDGPSTALLTFMEAYQFEAPSKWSGVRDIPLAR
ncbi:unnamed protein product [Effrenium voratum]|nr:unnamed protein product [Effrenium voratum]